jgi:N-ethylmaleimide reductase
MAATPSTTKLFSPLTLGGKNPVQLQHRVVMSPLTRLRADEDFVPTELIAEHYGQRATDGGLLIAEATNISRAAVGMWGAPGIWTSNQVEGWKKTTEAVHAKGGKIFVQLWHTGRMSHPDNLPNGETPYSSSAASMDKIPMSAVTRNGRAKYVTPRELDLSEIPAVIEDYKVAAKNAIDAGFDGVELHAANGYLPEQFLCTSVNSRTDEYGGSIENRARFTFEALEAILSVVESSKVGIRVSPYSLAYDCWDETPAETYSYLINKLNDYDLSFLHLVEPRVFHPGKDVPEIGVLDTFRPLYKGVIITASGYDREDAINTVESGRADAVAFGRMFISNPDLVKRLEIGAPLNQWDRMTAYWTDGVPLAVGYTDYPFLQEEQEKEKEQAKDLEVVAN